MCESCTPRRLYFCSFFTLVITGGLLAVGLLLPTLLDQVLTQGIKDQRVVTSNTSKGYSQWVSSNFPGAPQQYFKVFMFNCTNYLDVLYNDSKPIIRTTGPYVYQYNWHKFDIEFSPDGEYVTYYKFENYVYDAKSSNGADPKKDIVYVPNLPFLGAKAKIAYSDIWFESLGFDIVAALGNGSAFTAVTPHDFVWGYTSPFLQWLNETVGTSIPVNPYFLIEHNCTSEEEARSYLQHPNKYKTGKSNISEIGQYVTFRDQDVQVIWGTQNGNQANQIWGTDGVTFTINLNGEPLRVFSEDIYRHIELITNDTRTFQGVEMLMYFLNRSTFGNVTTFPEYNLQLPPGVANLTSVFNQTQGSPLTIISSQPYYFGADPYYQNNIQWEPPLEYDPDNHNTFLFVEPYTGITMSALKRLQVSVQMTGSLFMYPKLSPRVIPVVYFEESGTLNEFVADQWKSSVGLVVQITTYGPYGLYAASGLSLLISCYLIALGLKRRRQAGYSSIGDKWSEPAIQ